MTLATLSTLKIGSLDHELVNGLVDNTSQTSFIDSLALASSLKRALSEHSSSNPTGVEVSNDRIAAVIKQKVGGRSDAELASGFISEGFPPHSKLVAPPKAIVSLIKSNAKLFISRNAINSPNLNLLIFDLNATISSLEKERLERNSLSSIECGDLTIYPDMSEGHLSRYVIQTTNEPKPNSIKSIGFIATESRSAVA